MPRKQGTFSIRGVMGLLAAALLAGCYANNSPSSTAGSTGLSSKSGLQPEVVLAISPDALDPGDTAVATWSSTSATSCVATGAWRGTLALQNSAGQTLGPFTTSGTYSFGITCSGQGGTSTASHVVTVGKVPAPSILMDIQPPEIQPGASANITWSTTDATACVGSGGTNGWQGSEPTSNIAGFSSGVVTTSGAIQFALTCTGPGGSTQTTRTLTVSPSAPAAPPTLFFAAQPTQIAPGQASTLSWSASNASACTASGGTGSNWSGSEPTTSNGVSTGIISAEGSYSFTLTCAGPGGMIAKSTTLVVTTNLAPPAVGLNIAVAPSQIPSGGEAYLSWSTANANACVASGSWSGVESVLGSMVSTGTLTVPGVYSYTLVCSGPGGSTSGSAQLTVSAPPATVATLSATPTTITSGGNVSIAWTSNDATACAATGGTGTDGWIGAKPVSSTGTNIGPVLGNGTVVYTLVCTGPGGTGTPQSVSVTVNPATPIPPQITAFAAVPATIIVGQSSTLNWATVGATSCVASGGTGGWGGSVGTQSVGTSTGAINTAGAYTYTLTCTGSGGSSSSSVVVDVNSAPAGVPVITSFTLSPPTIQTGQSASLAWSTTGATACAASGAWSGSQPVSSSGTSTGTLGTAGAYTYTLTCTGPGGTSLPASLLLTVSNSPNAAEVTSFTATPTVVEVGQAVQLAWGTLNASTCTASGAWSGSEPTSSSGTSSGTISVAGVYTYTLTCDGPNGSAGPASVAVVATPLSTPPSIVAFTATPSTIETGQSAILGWVTLGATACNATQGTGTWGGSVPVSSVATSTGVINTAGSYTYTLACTGPTGSSTPSSVVLNVTAAPPPPASISLFTATPNTVLTGGTVLLTWASTSSTSCAAGGGASGDGWSGTTEPAIGTETVGPLNTAGVYTYTLTCTGPGGASAPMSVTVDVNSTPLPPVITSFIVTPATLGVGGSVTATWSSTGATSCTASGGTPNDGWEGAVAAQSTGTAIGPIEQSGVATYVLTCSGSGGAGLPASASVVVTPTTPPAAVTSFMATPAAIQTGQSAELTWASSNATSCTASAGTNSWGGSVPTSSTGTSTGIITAPGIYAFGLSCTGPGGTGLPAVATVTVTTLPPPVTITSFAATPATVQIGQSTSLSWSTSGASTCAASGGTGSDGWGGIVGASSTGTTVGPYNATGTVVYTLLCTGLGGVSSPTSIDVTVTPATPAATIGSFTASPTTVAAGGSTSLAWSSSNASACTASGGTGSDGWSGSVGTSSSGLSVGPLSAGTITYTLTCQGPGGTSAPSSVNVTVNPAASPPPTVTLVANGTNPTQVQPGASLTLGWSSTNATSCTASGGWSGTEPTSSGGVAVTAITTPGIYTYTLTCAGPGGSGASTVQVTVISSQSYDCGVPGVATAALVSPAAAVTTSESGVCLLGQCSVTNPGNVIDSTASNYATMTIPLGVLGSTTLDVTDTATFPAGREAGFVMTNGTSLLDLSLLGAVQIQTLLNGTVQETASTTGLGDVLQVQAAGLLAVDQYAGYAAFTTTKPFNAVQIVAGSLVALDSNLKVYSACVSQR